MPVKNEISYFLIFFKTLLLILFLYCDISLFSMAEAKGGTNLIQQNNREEQKVKLTWSENQLWIDSQKIELPSKISEAVFIEETIVVLFNSREITEGSKVDKTRNIWGLDITGKVRWVIPEVPYYDTKVFPELTKYRSCDFIHIRTDTKGHRTLYGYTHIIVFEINPETGEIISKKFIIM